MEDWKPTTDGEFDVLFAREYALLSDGQRDRFERFRVPFSKAAIRQSDKYGDEAVYVVARNQDGVLYFDDVEYGFNISAVGEDGRILNPGGSQFSLAEAIDTWFPLKRAGSRNERP